LSAKCPHWIIPPLSVRTYHKYRKLRWFFHQKERVSPLVRTGQIPLLPDCGRLLWTAPKQFWFLSPEVMLTSAMPRSTRYWCQCGLQKMFNCSPATSLSVYDRSWSYPRVFGKSLYLALRLRLVSFPLWLLGLRKVPTFLNLSEAVE